MGAGMTAIFPPASLRVGAVGGIFMASDETKRPDEAAMRRILDRYSDSPEGIILRLAWLHGLGRKELNELTWGQVDFETGNLLLSKSYYLLHRGCAALSLTIAAQFLRCQLSFFSSLQYAPSVPLLMLAESISFRIPADLFRPNRQKSLILPQRYTSAVF